MVLSLPPRSSVLPPGACNADELDKPYEERAKKGEERKIHGVDPIDRDVDAAAISRDDDGYLTASPVLEQTQFGLRMQRRPAEWSCGVRAVYSTARRSRNHPEGTGPPKATAAAALRRRPSIWIDGLLCRNRSNVDRISASAGQPRAPRLS